MLVRKRIPVAVGLAGVCLAALVGIWPPDATGLLGRVALMTWLLVATSIAVVDVREHRIPNILVACLTVLSLVMITAASAPEHDGGAALWTLVWAILAVGIALCVHVASAGSLGMGDVKLLFPVSLALGWFGSEAVWTALLVTPVLASLLIGYRSIAKLPQEPVPLAPYVVAGVAGALLVA